MAGGPMPQVGIYCIRNTINGRAYVGSSLNIRERWYGHKSNLRLGKHHSRTLQRSWNKYGPEVFVFEVLEELTRGDDLSAAEQQWLDKFAKGEHSSRVFNATANINFNRTKEALAKRAAGKAPLSEATKAKIGAANKGAVRTAAHRQAVSRAQLGRKKSPEHLEVLRQHALKRSRTPEGRAELEHRNRRLAEARAARKASGIKVKITAEHRERAIAQLVARNKTPEARAMAAAHIAVFNKSPGATAKRSKPRGPYQRTRERLAVPSVDP